MRHCRGNRLAFSLVELLVVIAILAVLFGLSLACVQSVRVTAARTDCQSRLRQLALAAQNHHSTHRRFPGGVEYPFSMTETDTHIRHAGISLQTSLLPQLDQDTLWGRAWAAHTAVPSGNSEEHLATAGNTVAAFRCPVDARQMGQFPASAGAEIPPWGLTNYLGVAGTGLALHNGVYHANFRVTVADIRDGTSNTVMIGERPTGPHGYGSSWYSGWGTLRYFKGQLMPVDEDWANDSVTDVSCPSARSVFQPGKYDDPCHHHHFWSLHPGGANFAFADGSVKFLRYSAVTVLPALATRAGGEVVPCDW